MIRTTKIDEQELIRQYHKGKTDREIAKALTKFQGINISQSGVSRARHRMRLPALHRFGNKKIVPVDDLYDKFLERNKKWKKDNPERVKEQFVQFQKDNRKRLSDYEHSRRLLNKSDLFVNEDLLRPLRIWKNKR